MYAWPPLNIFGRKDALGRTLTIKEINQQIATIGRVVLHPKYRSIGLGERLVRETLPLAGRPYVETMAVMAQYNPFFEKAGMQRICERQADPAILKAIELLKNMDFKPYLLASTQANLNHLEALEEAELRKIREAILRVPAIYYKRLKAAGEAYVEKKEFNEWIREISLEALAKVLSRLAVLAEAKVYLFWENLEETEK